MFNNNNNNNSNSNKTKMINEYVKKLIDNLPDNIKNTTKPQVIDLVLDGGAFNGSYLIGALYFLKEMENRNYVKVRRISGCSVGSFIAFMYIIDKLDMFETVCEISMKEFHEKHSFPVVTNIQSHIISLIPHDICAKINKKLYICYYNVEKQTKVVKSTYKSIDHVIDTIIKSSYIPYIVDGNIMYKKKYVDGITPYIFKTEPGVHVLHLNLLGIDKIFNVFNIKNEKTITHRALNGLLDIHNFYIKQSDKNMCSYVNDWTMINHSIYNFKLLVEKIIILFIYVLTKLDKYITPYIDNTLMYKIAVQIVKDTCLILLKQYCI